MKKKIPFKLKAPITQLIKNGDGWAPTDYEIEYRPDWDHDKVPLIVALPKTMMVDYSPMFCPLPTGKIITRHNSDGFVKIIEAYFPQIASQDVEILAELALKFGNFPHYPGALWKGNLDRFKNKSISMRTTSDPVYHQQGNRITIDFYAYDHELMQLSDCRIEIIGKRCTFHTNEISE